jgi:phage gp36-like protein
VTYAVQQDLIDRFGDAEMKAVADRDRNGVIDTVVVDKALTDADGEINGYLARRHALPLASVPDHVKKVACDLARLFLHAANPPEYVLTAARDARAWLRDVANGIVELGVSPPPAAAPGGAAIAGPARTFSAETMKGL